MVRGKPKHNNFPLLYVKVTVSHGEEYGWIMPPCYISTIITRKRVVNAKQIKDEIRKLSRIDKTAIYKWIDEEAATDLLLRIGAPANRTEAEWHPKRREHLSPPP